MSEKFSIPEDPQAERSLVACVHAGFQAHDAASMRALQEVDPDAFLVPQARALWLAMRSLHQRRDAIDPMTIHGELQRLGLISHLGNYAGVFEALSHDEFGHPEPLVSRINELHARRQLVALASSLDRGARDLVSDYLQTISEASTAMLGLSTGGRKFVRSGGKDLIARLAEGKPFRDAEHGAKLFYFPFEAWNDAVECAPGHVIIVGAAPKSGKTAFAVDSMVHTAQRGIDVGLISLEMDDDEVGARFAGRLTGQNSRMFLKASWSDAVVAGAMHNADAISRLHWWCHPSGVPWARVEAEIREMVRINGCKAVVIDYFTLIAKPSGSKGASDASLWGQLSMAIKRLAQELKICIVLLCQLNREGALGEPYKHNLRETGQLEQDGNALGFFWREQEGGPVWGKIPDNRSGPAVEKKQLQVDFGTCVFRMPESQTNPSTPSGW